MSKVNIRGFKQEHIDLDSSYRYKMSGVILNKSGETFIFQNILIISKEIKRDIKMIIQFLNKELSTSFIIKKTDVYVKKSDLTQKILQNCIYKFIDYCVICKHCKSPDTNIKTMPTKKYDGDISCDSCGKHFIFN
jgi:translation initiation factor 2 beta subunit (eIF-2beta)/eIF-5